MTTSFRVSSRCTGGDCVGVARDGENVVVACTKDVDGPRLHVTRAEWDAFVAGVKLGEFDLP